MSGAPQQATPRDDLAGEPVRVTIELPGAVLTTVGVVGSLTLTSDEDGRRTVAVVITEANLVTSVRRVGEGA